MRGMAFEVAAAFPPPLLEPNNNNNNNKLKEGSFGSNNNEPISVLDTRRSPSPSTSTSTLSSSFNGGATTTTNTTPSLGGTDNPQKWPDSVPQDMGISGYVSNFSANVDNGRKDDWPELQPIPAEFELQQQRFGVGLEDWENLLSESNGAQDQSLRWISGDLDDTNLSLQQLLQSNQIEHNGQIQESTLASHFNPQNANFLPFCNPDQNPQLVLNQTQFHQHPGFKKVPVFRQNVERLLVSDLGFVKDSVSNLGFHKGSILNPGHELLNKKPLLVAKQEPPHSVVSPVNNNNHHHHHQYQVICDQLFAAAELMLSGNFSHAQGILARLNHQFASASAPNKPFQRAAFYFKEALQLQLQSNLNPNKNVQPFNGMFKMGAYKMFSEVSPIIQFMNFTSNQTILEAIGDAKNIHIIDFDIGFGAQWSSFIQELPTKNNGGCSLKITAFASPSTHHRIELALMHENLSQFAQEIGISFELEVVNFDSFDPRSFLVSGNDTIAVNFPIWSASTHLAAIPSILHFIKQLSPTIVVSLDRGCERTDLPFPHYLLQGLQYFEVLLDSIDGSHVVSDVSNKIERFLFQPHIERMMSGKLQSPEPMPHWKSLYTAGGYSPVLFSNFAETQADCVVKRMQVHGFHIEKRQAALVLCWQNRELMTASAWKC